MERRFQVAYWHKADFACPRSLCWLIIERAGSEACITCRCIKSSCQSSSL